MNIRPARIEDAESLLRIYRHYIENTTITFEEKVPSVRIFKKRIESISAHYPYIVAEAGGTIIGFAYASQFRGRSAYRWLSEVAIYVDVNHQRKGAGKKLLSALLDILAGLGYYDAYAVVTLPNEGSIKLFESVGFRKNTMLRQAGYKLKRWCDVGIWVKSLRERSSSPDEPKSYINSKF